MIETIWNIHPAARVSAPNYVIEQIKQGLLRHELNPGDRLPSETELADKMGVSRGSVRQAMKALETLGVLSIRPGDGTYLNKSISKNNFNQLIFALLIAQPSLKEIVDFRNALECDIFEQILMKEEGFDALIEKLEDNVNQQDKMLEEDSPLSDLVENDQHFHFLLAEASGNTLFQTVYNYIMEYLEPYMIQTTSRQNAAGENFAAHDHRKLINALKTRDYSAITKAVQHSLQTWEKYMYEDDFTNKAPS